MKVKFRIPVWDYWEEETDLSADEERLMAEGDEVAVLESIANRLDLDVPGDLASALDMSYATISEIGH